MREEREGEREERERESKREIERQKEVNAVLFNSLCAVGEQR